MAPQFLHLRYPAPLDSVRIFLFNILFDQYGTVTIRGLGDTFPIMLVVWLWLVLVKSNSHDDLRCENHRIDGLSCDISFPRLIRLMR